MAGGKGAATRFCSRDGEKRCGDRKWTPIAQRWAGQFRGASFIALLRRKTSGPNWIAIDDCRLLIVDLRR